MCVRKITIFRIYYVGKYTNTHINTLCKGIIVKSIVFVCIIPYTIYRSMMIMKEG